MATDRLTLCMNLSNGAVTQYTNYDFNSYALLGEKLLAANTDGLFSLDDSNTDNGTSISASFTGPTTDFGSPYPKAFHYARIAYQSDSSGLTMSVTADGYQVPSVTILPAQIDLGRNRNLIRLDRAGNGRYFSVSVSNASGSDFQVSDIHLVRHRLPAPYLRGTTGINNKVPPERLRADPETGLAELARAENIDVDDRGEIFRRKGFTLRQTGSFHSLYSDGERTFVVKERTSDAALYRVQDDFSLLGIRSSLTQNATMTFTADSGEVFYSNGHETGKIVNDSSSAWTATAAHASEITVSREFYDPPAGSILCIYNGRVYVADGSTVWYSEWGSFNRFRKAEGWMTFQGTVQMLAPVDDGIYVSDTLKTYFLQGTALQFRKMDIADYPAISGTLAYTQGSRIMGGGVSGIVAVWTTPQGICIGGPGGSWRNVTEDRLTFPLSISGAGVVAGRWDGVPPLHMRYIVSLAP